LISGRSVKLRSFFREKRMPSFIVWLLVPLAVARPAFAEGPARAMMAAPIEVSRVTSAREADPGLTQLRFRGGPAQIAWFHVDGLKSGARVGDITAHFVPHEALTFRFTVDGEIRTAKLPTPDAIEIGYDDGHLLLFTLSDDGFDDTRVIREIRIRPPSALDTLASGLVATGVLVASAALPTWTWPLAFIVPTATLVARDSCVRWLSTDWSGSLRSEPHDFFAPAAR